MSLVNNFLNSKEMISSSFGVDRATLLEWIKILFSPKNDSKLLYCNFIYCIVLKTAFREYLMP